MYIYVYVYVYIYIYTFFIGYTVQIFITMRTAVESKKQQQIAIFGGLLLIQKHLKGRKQLQNH